MKNNSKIIYGNMWTGIQIIQHTTGQRKFIVWDVDKSKELCACFTEEDARRVVTGLFKSVFA